MSEVVRFTVSLEKRLLAQFDDMLSQKGYGNRSEALRDLIRDALVGYKWSSPEEVMAGTITLIYDHHVADLAGRLVRAQHEHHDIILSTMHIHMDHSHCLEVLAVRGKTGRIRALADSLIREKGVVHGKLVSTTTGSGLSTEAHVH